MVTYCFVWVIFGTNLLLGLLLEEKNMFVGTRCSYYLLSAGHREAIPLLPHLLPLNLPHQTELFQVFLNLLSLNDPIIK